MVEHSPHGGVVYRRICRSDSFLLLGFKNNVVINTRSVLLGASIIPTAIYSTDGEIVT